MAIAEREAEAGDAPARGNSDAAIDEFYTDAGRHPPPCGQDASGPAARDCRVPALPKTGPAAPLRRRAAPGAFERCEARGRTARAILWRLDDIEAARGQSAFPRGNGVREIEHVSQSSVPRSHRRLRARRDRRRHRRRRPRERGRPDHRRGARHAGKDGVHHPQHLRHRLRADDRRDRAPAAPGADGRRQRCDPRHRLHDLGRLPARHDNRHLGRGPHRDDPRRWPTAMPAAPISSAPATSSR